MQTYRNTAYTGRNPDCANVVACVAAEPPAPHWVPCTRYILSNLTQLYIRGDVTYYGYL